MTISINTSEYTKYKEVEIDGELLKIRPMNSAETLALMQMQKVSKENGAEALEKMINLFMGLFDKPERAKELLKNLSVDALAEIYQKVMAE